MYKCCIFDLDGTLINTIHAITNTVNITLSGFGLGPIDEDHCKIFVGDAYKKLLERALIHCGDTELKHYDEAVKLYPEIFEQHCMDGVHAYEGILQVLKILKDKGIKLAVLSNKETARAKDNIHGIFGMELFDRVAGETPGIEKKPDPAGVYLTMEALGVAPEDCLYIGDTNTDMQTGISAGLDTVGVLWGFRERSELEAFHPMAIIEEPMALLNIIGEV